jgi:hypothetical protein
MSVPSLTELLDLAWEFCDPHHEEMRAVDDDREVCEWCDFEPWPCRVQRLSEAVRAWRTAVGALSTSEARTALWPCNVCVACAEHERITLDAFWPYGTAGTVRRTAPQVRARRLAALILRDEGWSFPGIARIIGYADHQSVRFLVTRCVTDEDRATAAQIRRNLIERLNEGSPR